MTRKGPVAFRCVVEKKRKVRISGCTILPQSKTRPLNYERKALGLPGNSTAPNNRLVQLVMFNARFSSRVGEPGGPSTHFGGRAQLFAEPLPLRLAQHRDGGCRDWTSGAQFLKAGLGRKLGILGAQGVHVLRVTSAVSLARTAAYKSSRQSISIFFFELIGHPHAHHIVSSCGVIFRQHDSQSAVRRTAAHACRKKSS